MTTIGETLTIQQLNDIRDNIVVKWEKESDGVTFRCYESNKIKIGNGSDQHFHSCTKDIQIEEGVSDSVKNSANSLNNNSTLQDVQQVFIDWVKEKEYVAKKVEPVVIIKN